MGRRGPRHGGGGGGGGGGSGGGGQRGGGPPPPPPPPPQVITEEHPPVKGPHPGYVSVACQYTPEQQLRRMQRDNGCDPSREDSYRLQGVQLIDNVRESLQLFVSIAFVTLLLLRFASPSNRPRQTRQDVRNCVHILPPVPSELPRCRIQLPRRSALRLIRGMQSRGHNQEVQGGTVRGVQLEESGQANNA